MNQCTNCGAAITDDDLIIWKCQECGKKYKIKMSKVRQMQILKNKTENTGKSILRCRECGIEMDNGNEDLSFKCRKCVEVISGNLEYFASDDDVDMESTWNEETEKEEAVLVNNENTITCPECGEKVSDSVDTCPECGYPIKEEMDKALLYKEKQITKKDKKKNKSNKIYKDKTNKIGNIFSTIGWIIIIFGMLFDFLYIGTGISSNDNDIVIMGFVYAIGILLSGLIPLAFAEVLFLLENIRDRLNEMDN